MGFLRIANFLVAICIFQSCVSPLGDMVNENFDNYYYSPDKKEILYCPNVDWDRFDVTKMEADVNTFEVISYGFSKDKDHLFCGPEKISNSLVDKNSFFTRDEEDHTRGIGFDKNGVYVFFGQDVPFKIEHADPKTYKVLNYGRQWAKDANKYYYKDHLYYYLMQEYNGEMLDKMIKTPYVDFETIKEIGYYLRVDDALYYNGNRLKGIDVDTLETHGAYIKGKHLAFYKGNKGLMRVV